MNNRVIIEMTNGSSIPLSTIHSGIKNKRDVIRIWTIYDEERIIENSPFNPYTGEKVNSPLNAHLQHLEGAFIEDFLHDWKISDNELHMYSRVTSMGKPITLLIEISA